MTEPMKLQSLLEAAIAMHEIYLSLIQAGFTEHQSLIIVANMTRGQS